MGASLLTVINNLGLTPINKTVLITTVLSTLTLIVVYVRVFFIQDAYYDERFKTTNLGNGQTEVKYMQSTSINPILLILMLFKPMKAVTVNSFVVDIGEEKLLEGKLTANNGRMSIGDYHLKENHKIFEYLGEEVKIGVRGNRRELIEKNLQEYEILSVHKK